jgi:DNA-binding PadR family transcriptional regulator
VLSPTDVRIIDAVVRIRKKKGLIPAASDIQKELSKSVQLKKTQLYERLNRLTKLGFLSVKQLPRPRRYAVDKNTITQGVERWVEEQRESVVSLSSELETLHEFLNRLNSKTVVSAITEKLSIEFDSS